MNCPNDGYGMWYRENPERWVCPNCDEHIDIEQEEEEEEEMSIRERWQPGGDKYESMQSDLIREKVQEAKEQEARDHAAEHGRDTDVWESENVE